MKWTFFIAFSLLLLSCKKDEPVESNGSLQVLNDQTFQSNVKNGTGVSVVFYHAAWCSICKDQRPHVESAAEMSSLNAVFFGEIDHVDYEPVFDAEGVSFFPQIWIYKDGVFKEAINGAGSPTTSAEIEQAITPYL